MSFPSTKYVVLGCVHVMIGIVLGAVGVGFWQGFGAKIYSTDVREVVRPGTVLTSPLLECRELTQSVSDESLSRLHVMAEKAVREATSRRDIMYASVYFRDLNNGPWFGINESDVFFPASLLKLPLAMSFYNAAEDDPSVLTKQITYKPDPSAASQLQPFGPTHNVEVGKAYTAKDLIDIMLQESSNESAVALADMAGPDQIKSVYHDLGLSQPVFGQDYKIDTHRYASFFRILYNATYLDRNASEIILRSLTNASFKDGLVAGVPAEVTVAHKFGTRAVDAAGKTVQLHDCGIVYVPDKPYLLCVMTQGTDFTKLAQFIQSISALIFQNVGK